MGLDNLEQQVFVELVRVPRTPKTIPSSPSPMLTVCGYLSTILKMVFVDVAQELVRAKAAGVHNRPITLRDAPPDINACSRKRDLSR
jgi:hypothetical protein